MTPKELLDQQRREMKANRADIRLCQKELKRLTSECVVLRARKARIESDIDWLSKSVRLNSLIQAFSDTSTREGRT